MLWVGNNKVERKVVSAADYQWLNMKRRHCRINKVKLKPGHQLGAASGVRSVSILWLRDPSNAIERLRP